MVYLQRRRKRWDSRGTCHPNCDRREAMCPQCWSDALRWWTYFWSTLVLVHKAINYCRCVACEGGGGEYPPHAFGVFVSAPKAPPTYFSLPHAGLLAHLFTSNVTGRPPGYRAPSVQRTSHVAMRFHRRLWYRALSLRYAYIRSSAIILIP